jgi:hypothetical protein
MQQWVWSMCGWLYMAVRGFIDKQKDVLAWGGGGGPLALLG